MADPRSSVSSVSPDPTPNLALRVGCSLCYNATGPATILLAVMPDRVSAHTVLQQALTVGDNLPAPEIIDSHGNAVCRVRLSRGLNWIRHDAIVTVPARVDNAHLRHAVAEQTEDLPDAVLRYVLPSRYCDSDRLTNFAWEKFGHIEHGLARVDAISRWVHENIEYRYMSGRPDLTAGDVLRRGYGVCRDFAHLVVALNRTFNLPARYVTGHMPDIGFPDPDNHMDFHAYAEIYVGGIGISRMRGSTSRAQDGCISLAARTRSMEPFRPFSGERRSVISKCGPINLPGVPCRSAIRWISRCVSIIAPKSSSGESESGPEIDCQGEVDLPGAGFPGHGGGLCPW